MMIPLLVISIYVPFFTIVTFFMWRIWNAINKVTNMTTTSLEKHDKKTSIVTSIVIEDNKTSLCLKNGDIIQSENIYDKFIDINTIKVHDEIEYKNYTYYDYDLSTVIFPHKIISKENAIKILKITVTSR